MKSFRRSLATLVTLASLSTASAWAGRSRDTLVYQFSSAGLESDQSDVPDALTHRVAKAMHAKANVMSMDDVAGTMDCDASQRACLEAVLGKTEATKIVFGTVTQNVTGKLKVVLTVYSTDGGKDEESYVLDADNADDAADELVDKAQDQLDTAGGGSGSGSGTEPPLPPVTHGGNDSTPGVSNGTYALIGVGAASTIVGIGFLVSAQGIRNQIADHPTADRQDFTEIQALETTGKTRAFLGYGLAGAGVALGVYGIYRAMHEREPAKKKAADPADPGTNLDSGFSLIPVQGGGAAFTFSGNFQ